jgi:ligand-binding sensor domain-containing protein
MLLRLKLYLLLSLAICNNLTAKNFFTNHAKYTTEHGLLTNNIYSLFQDQTGLLWIGGSNGISMYNAYQFKSFPIPNHNFIDTVQHISQINKNQLFVGTNLGVYVFDISGKDYRLIPTSEKQVKNLAFSFQIKGRYFLGGKTGIFEYLPQKQTIQKINNMSVSCGQQTPGGKIWLGTFDQGIHEIELVNDRLQNKSIFHEMEESIISIHFKADNTPLVHTQNGLWIRDNNGFRRDVGGTFSTTGINLNDDIYMTVYKKGFMYQTDDSNLPYFDEGVNSELNDYYERQFTVSLTDESGAIWLGTKESGLIKIDNKNICYSQFTTGPDISINYVNGILAIDNNVLAGLSQIGLFCVDIKKKQLTPLLTDEKVKFIEAIVRKDSMIFLGTRYHGVLSVIMRKGNTFKPEDIKHIYNDKIGLLKDSYILDLSLQNDIISIAGRQGCFSYSLKRKTFEKISDIPSYKYRRDSLGNDWNVSTKNELYYNGDKIHPNTFVSDFTFDKDNNLWLASNDGLALIKSGTQELSFFKPHQGNFTFTSLLIDPNGQIWIGSRMGIFCYHPEKNSFARYKIKGKSTNNSFNKGTITMSEEGQIMLGSNNGIIAICSMKYKLLPPPKFQVQEHINGEEGIFSISNLSFNHQEDNAIAYRFVHPDSTWHINQHDNRIIDLSDLPPFTYELEFNAINSDGVWGESYTTSFWTENKDKPRIFIYAIVIFFVLLLVLAKFFLKNEDESHTI